MIIGVPREIKNNENRVALTPGGTKTLTRRGHRILVETAAGVGSGFSDEEYINSGAEIYTNKKQLFNDADMIMKVKEPLKEEYSLFKEDQCLFTYLHLAPNPELTNALLQAKVIGIAYETIELPNKSLPLLAPMSEVAGRMAVQIGANLLQSANGGAGILLGGVPGVAPAEVVIVGGGNVGINAAKIAVGMGARVTILDINAARLAYIDDIFLGRITTLAYNEHNCEAATQKANLLIGAVLVAGESAPKTVSEEMVKKMAKGSVIVDVAIDQGGSIETIDRITTHDNPSYEKHGVIHYSVANMPGAVPRTSTFALEAATLQYAIMLADKGVETAVMENEALMKGLNTYKGIVTCQGVAKSQNIPYVNPRSLIK